MTSLIVLVIIAGGLLVMRMHEIRRGKLFVISHIIQKADNVAVQTATTLDNFFDESGVVIRYIKDGFIRKVSGGFVFIVSFTKQKIDSVHDKVNGKGVIKENGSASFYLKSVSEHKNQKREERDN